MADEINTNAEYVPEEELNLIEGKDGELLDPIEQNQDPETFEDDEVTGQRKLREALEEDEDQENILDE